MKTSKQTYAPNIFHFVTEPLATLFNFLYVTTLYDQDEQWNSARKFLENLIKSKAAPNLKHIVVVNDA